MTTTTSAPIAYPPEILRVPMQRVCARLHGLGVDLRSCHALEFFAREGNWHTVSYAAKVARLVAWEINPDFEEALRRNLPQARICIGDSFALSRLPDFAGQFDFIVYDNPQVTFGDTHQYCEHFETLETLPSLMKQSAVVIFNINREPFNYGSFPEWQRRRNRFYRIADASRLELDFLMAFYKDYFQARGIRIQQMFIEPRHESYLAYFVGVVTKNTFGDRS